MDWSNHETPADAATRSADRIEWNGGDLGDEYEFQWQLRSSNGGDLECRVYWNKALRVFHVCTITGTTVINCERVDTPALGRAIGDDWRKALVGRHGYEDLGLPRTVRLFSGY